VSRKPIRAVRKLQCPRHALAAEGRELATIEAGGWSAKWPVAVELGGETEVDDLVLLHVGLVQQYARHSRAVAAAGGGDAAAAGGRPPLQRPVRGPSPTARPLRDRVAELFVGWGPCGDDQLM